MIPCRCSPSRRSGAGRAPRRFWRRCGGADRVGSTDAEFDRVADEAVIDVVRLQERAGCDLVTDGELRRDNFYSFVADKLDGVRLMTLAEMLDVVEDKAGFERLLQTLDVPAYAIRNPTCIGRHRAARAARARRSAVPPQPDRSGRSRSRCPAPTC